MGSFPETYNDLAGDHIQGWEKVQSSSPRQLQFFAG